LQKRLEDIYVHNDLTLWK